MGANENISGGQYVTTESAIVIARSAAERNQYPFVGEIRVTRRGESIHVMSNAACRGMNVNVWINVRTGDVEEIGYAIR